jgi:hypothetical protein
MKKHVHILGSKWTILHLKESEDARLEKCDGYCDWTKKQIVVEKCEPDLMSLHDLDAFERATLRHEIIHAFLMESGLNANSMHYDGAWARNEEMVDWFAVQGQKIYAAWQEAGAI